MVNENYIKICPRCGSIKVNPYTHVGTSEGEFLLDHCPDCGWNKIFPEILESKVEEFREEIERMKGLRQLP